MYFLGFPLHLVSLLLYISTTSASILRIASTHSHHGHSIISAHPAHLKSNASNHKTISGKAAGSNSSLVQQNLSSAPPFPILDIGNLYIHGQSGVNSTQYRYAALSKNVTHQTTRNIPLNKRVDGPVQCSSSTPCADGSCCNSDGKCGFKPYHCHPDPPVTCLSNCDAKAMCGVDSADGKKKCGLNLCCSYYGWCGTEDIHCVNADPIGLAAPCQKGFGGCAVVPPPVCGAGSGTASGGRKVAYYQSWNTRDRQCNRISPSQIVTKDLTHLNFAFASIDPVSFQVTPLNSADEDLYPLFTALKTPKLQTWIAIGGFDFSDPGTPTHTTWSDMASTQSNRAAFISSLVAFMKKWGFQGADIDWEYPASDVRGGRDEDTVNLVALVQEMRAAFGTSFGLSSILAPDYWYLRGMDPKGMEPYVDFFGFMAYDLHGSWDADVKTLGSLIRPQSDIREIDKDLLPLWFDSLNPAKVNFGLAYYGRGYTVSDTSCMYPGCGFSGPSDPAPCTAAKGVMSLREIQQLIENEGIVPELLSDPMIKQITWDDQWIGYDDADTIAMKLGVANNRCLGGTMAWSVDFNSGAGSGDTPDLKPSRKGTVHGTWQSAQCTNSNIIDASIDQTKRWNSIDTDDAWIDAIASWTANPNPGGLSFSEQISNFFHGPEQMQCGVTTDHNGCDTPLLCSDVNYPAGYFILNSFIAINNMNLNFYDSISRAQSTMTSTMGNFAKTFAPVQSDTSAIKMILDMVGLGFAMFAAPVWNIELKQVKYWIDNPNQLGLLKDTVNSLVSNSITIIKDGGVIGDTINTQNTLEVNMSALMVIWYNLLSDLNAKLFDGSDESIAQLQSMTTGGKMLQPGKAVSDLIIQNDIERATYGYLIPKAWSVSNEKIHPFILDSGVACSTKKKNPVSDFLSDKDAAKTSVCYNNKLYYLVSATGDNGIACLPGTQCTNIRDFTPPPGISALDGKSWGGIILDDIVIGSIATYQANGNKNGGSKIDPGNEDDISALYDANIRTPGVMTLPVCSGSVAQANYASVGPKGNPFFPCSLPKK